MDYMLEFSYLRDLGYSFKDNEKERCDNLYNNLFLLKDLKPDQKLRIVNGLLVIDNRKYQSIARKLSGDSRIKIIPYLKKFDEEISKLQYIDKEKLAADLFKVINVLKKTYSKDQKFLQELEKMKKSYSYVSHLDIKFYPNESKSTNNKETKNKEIKNKEINTFYPNESKSIKNKETKNNNDKIFIRDKI